MRICISACISLEYRIKGKVRLAVDKSALTFELTDEAKAAYLGIDGKEVGIYGGDYPYTSTPSYPQITKMDVSRKVSADGKLNVEIEVNAAE